MLVMSMGRSSEPGNREPPASALIIDLDVLS